MRREVVSMLPTPLFYTELSMSYAAAIDRLNAMVPELYTQLRPIPA